MNRLENVSNFGILHSVFNQLEEALNSGDPHVKEWFLVKSNFWPFFLCCIYFIFVRKIGPAFMKDRKPYELRNLMIIYNFLLVATYAVCVTCAMYLISKTPFSILCKNSEVTTKNTTYALVTCGWIIYLVKYVEFLDTIFFVLRRKNNLITNLHVIHHTLLPIFGWIVFRTEKSGFIAFPIMINSIVHTVMYSYYGLAAMGPSVRKYLWWKRYLTIMQMTQFVLIVFFVIVVMPVLGCTTAKTSFVLNVSGATFFFALFYNFYQRTFKKTPAEPIREKCT